jgi:hypothetical protein
MNSLERAAERFAKLPPGFQRAIIGFDYDKRLAAVQQKFKLHIDQAFMLEKNLADIVFGDAHSTTLTKSLERDLHTTQEQAEQISHDINEHVLLPLREVLKEQG